MSIDVLSSGSTSTHLTMKIMIKIMMMILQLLL